MTSQEANSLSLQVVWPWLHGTPAPEAGRKCLAPYRPDKNPNCYIKVFGNREYFHDWADSKKPRNVIAFTARCLGLNENSSSDFHKVMVSLNEAFGDGRKSQTNLRRPSPIRPQKPTIKEWVTYEGELHTPTESQIQQILSSRKGQVSLDGLRLAIDRGNLFAAMHKGHACYAVTDKTRRAVDFRRLDGELFIVGGRVCKTLSPAGLGRRWPVGLMEMVDGQYQDVILTEGSGDLLSAHKPIFAEGRQIDRPSFPKVCVVTILGATINIPADCLQYFAGRRIWIYPDNDKAGRDAACRWCAQLEQVSDQVKVFPGIKEATRRDGTVFKDFGDFMSVKAHELVGFSGLVCPH